MAIVHYIVIRRDLTFGEYSAQLGHAGEAYALRRDVEQRVYAEWMCTNDNLPKPHEVAFNETTVIVKGIRNEGRLLKLEAELKAAGVPHVAIREEEGEKGGRIAGQLTVVSFMPAEPGPLQRHLNGIHTIECLDALGLVECEKCKRPWAKPPAKICPQCAPLQDIPR